MKGFNLIVIMILFCSSLSLIPILVPSYNNGNGLSAGTQQGAYAQLTTTVAQYQLTGSGLFGKALTQANSLDIVTYIFQLTFAFIMSAISVLSVVFVAYPLMVSVIGIPAVLSAFLQVLITFIEIFALWELWHGNLVYMEGP